MLCFSIPFSFGLGAPVSGGGGTGTWEIVDWSAQIKCEEEINCFPSVSFKLIYLKQYMEHGHGMREAIFLLNGLENEDLYDYSEWIIEDSAGTIKIEHIMYFTGHIYKHNVSVEIIR